MPEQRERPKRAYRRTSETQQIIFDAAMKLMSEKGVQGTTVREICAAAGVPIGTFYNCYKSKVEILKRLYDNGDAYIRTAIAEEAKDLDPLEHLSVFAGYYAKLNERTGIDVLRVLFYPMNEWFTIERPMQIYAKRFVESGQDSGIIRNDLAAQEIVDSLFDILRGVTYNWCVCDGSFDLLERISAHMKLFCASISADQQ